MNKTSNYQLNQWELTDRIRMEDFNGDNAKIDAALAGLAGQVASKASSSTVSSLSTKVNTKAAQSDLTAAVNRITALESGKAEKTALAAEQTARENADNAEKAAREAADAALENTLRGENCWVKLGEWALTTSAAEYSIPVTNAGNYRELRMLFENCTPNNSYVYMLINDLSDGNYGSVDSTNYNGEIKLSRITLDSRGGSRCAGSISFFPMGSGCTGYSCEAVTLDVTSVWSAHHVGMHKALGFSALTSLKVYTTSNTLLSGTSFALYGLKK